MNLRTVKESDVVGKRVLCRFDFNVPLSESDQLGVRSITDTSKIDLSLVTIQFLVKAGARELVLMSHLGQPTGADPNLTLKPVADYLAKSLNKSQDLISQSAVKGGFEAFVVTENIFLLENVRFNEGEEESDTILAKQYALLGDVFIFDAFASAHREHASTAGISDLLPSYAGLLLSNELKHLTPLRSNTKRPFAMIIGGAKIVDKLPVIQSLESFVDTFLVGGAVANTFLKAGGEDVRESLVDDQNIVIAKQIIEKLGDRLVLPVDHVWDADAIVDIGPRTTMLFEDRLTDAATVLWNGNLGKTEERKYSRGSLLIADFLSRMSDKMRIIAGGDTSAFVREHNLAEKMTFVSTGGGATLDFLAGKSMPVLDKLEIK